MRDIFSIITVVSMILMTVFILVQQKGASLGAAFGGSNELHRTKRGVEKAMHRITILLAMIFVLSIVLGIIAR